MKDIIPVKSVRVSNEDNPFFSAELKKLDRYVKKEYRQKGKSTKYLRLKTADDSKYRKAAAFYLNGCVADMMVEAPGKAYRAGHHNLQGGLGTQFSGLVRPCKYE